MKTIIHSSKSSLIAIWQIEATATITNMSQGLPAHFQQEALKFGSAKRQKEYLAVRQLLYQVLESTDFDISYLPSGQPTLQNTDYQYIAISHTTAFAAVYLHKTKKVGIDLEQISPKSERIKQRFLNDKELAFIAIQKEKALFFYTLFWTAKESLYKYFGEKNLNFKKQLHIFSIKESNLLKGKLSAYIYDQKGGIKEEVIIYYEVFERHILSYCTSI